MRLGFLLVVLVGCATDVTSVDDGEAETAPAQVDSKADAASFAGMYQAHTTHHYNGDIPALELRADGTFVRSRCYHASCAMQEPETDHYDTYTSSSGKQYVRFWSWTPVRDGNGDLTPSTTIGDVYEIRTFSHGVQLRKSYSTRWQSLYASSPSLACAASGGAWAQGGCSCPGNTPGVWPSKIFVAGAGGCIHNPGSSEDGCDSSDGQWTDDDTAANGTFCLCGYNRYLDDSGSCAAL